MADFFSTPGGIAVLILAQVLAVVAFVMISLLFLVYGDRKIWAAVQMRRGPNVVGLFGLLQTVADALKYVVKEVVIPAGADKTVFMLAPWSELAPLADDASGRPRVYADGSALTRYLEALGPLMIGGSGPVVDRLEWDTKLYLALNGATHDSAIAAWGIKGWYDYLRPLSAIRAMADRGQSSAAPARMPRPAINPTTFERTVFNGAPPVAVRQSSR